MNYFENVMINNLISRFNVCEINWGEQDCVYAYNKLYYFIEGEATLILNGDVFTPEPEELFLIPANTPHTYYHNADKPVLKYWSHFNLILDQEKKLNYHKETVRCKIPKDQIIPLFEALIETEMSNHPLDVLSEKIALLEILKIFLTQVDLTKILPTQSNEFSNIINAYIRENLHSGISINKLANLVHLHPNYFIKVFKKHFSVTPMEYVNAMRLQLASKLLTYESAKSIQTIANEAGFNDYRYFSRIFKKKYGVSPSQYKKG